MSREMQIRINKLKKDIIKQRKELSYNSKILNEFKKFKFSKRFRIALGVNYIYLYIDKLEDLRTVRQELRDNFGTWKDSCSNISSYWSSVQNDYKITYHWKGDYKGIPITLCLSDILYQEIPEELRSLKEGCKFKETVNTVTEEIITRTLEYICHV